MPRFQYFKIVLGGPLVFGCEKWPDGKGPIGRPNVFSLVGYEKRQKKKFQNVVQRLFMV